MCQTTNLDPGILRMFIQTCYWYLSAIFLRLSNLVLENCAPFGNQISIWISKTLVWEHTLLKNSICKSSLVFPRFLCVCQFSVQDCFQGFKLIHFVFLGSTDQITSWGHWRSTSSSSEADISMSCASIYFMLAYWANGHGLFVAVTISFGAFLKKRHLYEMACAWACIIPVDWINSSCVSKACNFVYTYLNIPCIYELTYCLLLSQACNFASCASRIEGVDTNCSEIPFTGRCIP